MDSSDSIAEALFTTFCARQAFTAFSRLDAVQRQVVAALTDADRSAGLEVDASMRDVIERFKVAAVGMVDELAGSLDFEPEPDSVGSALRVLAGPMSQVEAMVRGMVEDAAPSIIAGIDDQRVPELTRAAEQLLAEPLLPLGLDALLTSTVACFEHRIRSCIALDLALRTNDEWDDIAQAATKAMYRRGWVDYFVQRGVAITTLTPCWPDVVEVLARRNAVVHNGGKADERYRKDTGRDDVPDGEALAVDPAYLARATDLLAALAILVPASLHPVAEDAAGQVSEFALYLLQTEQPRRAELLLVGSADMHRHADGADGMDVWRVNVALARKAQYGASHVAHDVEGWTLPVERPDLVLARDVLLDRPVTSERLTELVEQGHLSWEDVRTWPLFKDLRRQSPEIQRVLGTASGHGFVS